MWQSFAFPLQLFLVWNSRDWSSSLYYPPFYWTQNYWQDFWDVIAGAFSIFALDIIWAITDNVKATGYPHRDGGMDIRAQMVRISTVIERSGKVPKLQFSRPWSGNNLCAQNRTGRCSPCKSMLQWGALSISSFISSIFGWCIDCEDKLVLRWQSRVSVLSPSFLLSFTFLVNWYPLSGTEEIKLILVGWRVF